MPKTLPLVSSAVAASGLVGGFLLARSTGRRELGGLLFTAAGAWCARDWYRTSGPAAAAGLSVLYLAAMGGSHPLAKRIGAWPSVTAVTAMTVAAAELVTRASGSRPPGRSRSRRPPGPRPPLRGGGLRSGSGLCAEALRALG